MAQSTSSLSHSLKRIVSLWLAEKNYMLAIEQYGKAIDSNPLSAVYHANRAFAHIRMETYGSAVEDAAQAIALDPKYVKVWLQSVLLLANLFLLRGKAGQNALLLSSGLSPAGYGNYKLYVTADPSCFCTFDSAPLSTYIGLLPARGCPLCPWQVQGCSEGFQECCQACTSRP